MKPFRIVVVLALAIVTSAQCEAAAASEPAAMNIRIPISAAGEVDIAEVVARVAAHAEIELARPRGPLPLPIMGRAGALTRQLLQKSLGDDAVLTVEPKELAIVLPAVRLQTGQLPALKRGLAELAESAQRAADYRAVRYGMHARESYRPNDPSRPTVCLVHGLNSSAEVFVHMVGPLEEAGYGVVIYDFPYNRDLDASAIEFCRDWSNFRRQNRERLPWAIVAHSLGGLLARAYVEASPTYAGDVRSLILIAPPNQGSGLAQGQTMLQFLQSVRAVNTQKSAAMFHLSDGLGAAADDMMPGSAFLKALNSHKRRASVKYHILAGDGGFLSPTARKQVEAQMQAARTSRGLLGGIARLATADMTGRLDEMTEGAGDGCISLDSTKLDGVSDHVTIHANHLELIRAPLLYPEPGPVVSMPYLLKWLAADMPKQRAGRIN